MFDLDSMYSQKIIVSLEFRFVSINGYKIGHTCKLHIDDIQYYSSLVLIMMPTFFLVICVHLSTISNGGVLYIVFYVDIYVIEMLVHW